MVVAFLSWKSYSFFLSTFQSGGILRYYSPRKLTCPNLWHPLFFAKKEDKSRLAARMTRWEHEKWRRQRRQCWSRLLLWRINRKTARSLLVFAERRRKREMRRSGVVSLGHISTASRGLKYSNTLSTSVIHTCSQSFIFQFPCVRLGLLALKLYVFEQKRRRRCIRWILLTWSNWIRTV